MVDGTLTAIVLVLVVELFSLVFHHGRNRCNEVVDNYYSETVAGQEGWWREPPSDDLRTFNMFSTVLYPVPPKFDQCRTGRC